MESETRWGEGSSYILGQGGAAYLDSGPPRHRWVGGQRRCWAGEGEWTSRYKKKKKKLFRWLKYIYRRSNRKTGKEGKQDQRKHSGEEISEEMNVRENQKEMEAGQRNAAPVFRRP